MSKRKRFVKDLQRPHFLMCGKHRSTVAEAATRLIDVTCKRCLGRMVREAEADYERHTAAARRARQRVAQLSAQLDSGRLVI